MSPDCLPCDPQTDARLARSRSQLVPLQFRARPACVLTSSCVERVSLQRHPPYRLAPFSRIPVLLDIQGMINAQLQLASRALPDERPRPHRPPSPPTLRDPPTGPVLLPRRSPPPLPTAEMSPAPRRQHRRCRFPTSRPSSGRISPCPNPSPNLPPCRHQRYSRRC
jgi:hypothetical protein